MKTRNKFATALIGTCLLTLVSCGSDNGSSGSTKAIPKKNTTKQELQQDDQGFYRAELRPINSHLADETSGTFEFRIEGDDVTVTGHVKGAPAGVRHFQNVMTLTKCPTEKADMNKDSIIDILESISQTGKILIPLDSNLSEQLLGMDFGPIANSAGEYRYKRSTSLTSLLSDLRALDPDPADKVVKLPLGQELNLSGRVLVIHGVANDTELPESVSSIDPLTAAQSLPIACGTILRVADEEKQL